MEFMAFSMSYTHRGRQGTAVVYATRWEAAASEFGQMYPLRMLERVDLVHGRKRRRSTQDIAVMTHI